MELAMWCSRGSLECFFPSPKGRSSTGRQDKGVLHTATRVPKYTVPIEASMEMIRVYPASKSLSPGPLQECHSLLHTQLTQWEQRMGECSGEKKS